VLLSTGLWVRGGPPSLVPAILFVVHRLLLQLQLSFLNGRRMMLMEMMEILLLLLYGYRDAMLLPSFSVRWRCRGRCRRVRGYRRRPFCQRHAHIAHLQPLARQPVLGQCLGRAPRRPAPAKHEVRVFCAALHFHLMWLGRRGRNGRYWIRLFVVTADLKTKTVIN